MPGTEDGKTTKTAFSTTISQNLAPHLWRLHHLKIKTIIIINGEAEREEAQRRGEGERRARGAGWTPSRQGARGVSGPPRAIAARPRPAIFGDGSREHLRASPREAPPPPPPPPPLRAAPRRAPFWQGAVSAEAARGRHRARERGAASLLPPAPPRPRPPLPAPARPPARPRCRYKGCAVNTCTVMGSPTASSRAARSLPDAWPETSI